MYRVHINRELKIIVEHYKDEKWIEMDGVISVSMIYDEDGKAKMTIELDSKVNMETYRVEISQNEPPGIWHGINQVPYTPPNIPSWYPQVSTGLTTSAGTQWNTGSQKTVTYSTLNQPSNYASWDSYRDHTIVYDEDPIIEENENDPQMIKGF